MQLLTSGAVHRWGREIQDGIYDMLQLLIDLVATRVQHLPVPIDLLEILALVSLKTQWIERLIVILKAVEIVMSFE